MAQIIPLLGGVRGGSIGREILVNIIRITDLPTPKSPPKRGLSNFTGEIVMSVNGKYIYGFMRHGAKPSFTIPGIDGKPVFTISDNDVAAVVSDGPDGKLRPERKNLSAHHSVIKEIMKTLTILPVSFGVVADNEASIKKILKLNRDSFISQLKRMEGKVEMGLKINWDVENIFEFMVRKHRTLELFRDNIF
ncbi:MAG TPA: GvpL/GvpF family gas vesicle protein, partial [Candidatus Brocadiaceae bacterium]